MSHGIPLTDADRAPWLEAMRKAILETIAAGKNVVLACSALKRAYRDKLRPSPEVKIVYLKGDYALFAERIRHRHGHFAGEQILAGQFADLEEPMDAITIDAAHSPEEIVAEIRERLALS
jgi:gluconokinase